MVYLKNHKLPVIILGNNYVHDFINSNISTDLMPRSPDHRSHGSGCLQQPLIAERDYYMWRPVQFSLCEQ
ncbi:hypothetical protein KFK09_019434 [Dendrobium nobile]|uniref:Uncharacterized protein n=1 Tax=Dendrobium nobile TaxID=94219 RepID=A0A8T3APH7_DENNO|nr:hypothetical protein KFK09_019434 [Dendrobium nobile]